MAKQRSEQVIDLAPNHKLGLVVANPILLGAGAIGYGEAVPRGLDLGMLGAAVVGPVLGGSRGGKEPPRLAHLSGGVVLATGLQNRGVNNAIQQYGKLWGKLPCPVIVQVAESHPATLAKVLAKLGSLPGVQGIELLPPPEVDAGQLAVLLRSAERACELPLWVKLPLAQACRPGPGRLRRRRGGAGDRPGAQRGCGAAQQPLRRRPRPRSARLRPLLFTARWSLPQMLEALLQVAALRLPAALIACGGIHTLEQVRQALAAGAQAVQIDSAVWVEPGLPARLAADCLNPDS